ncbi:MAG: chitinase, partial [Burkholderiales bacterium]|nr:chitinase [Burkholderiales bacterium]
KQVQADEISKTSSPLFQNIKASIRTLDSAAVELVQAGRVANPTNVKRIEKILNVNDWQTLFPMRDASYSYVRFLQAMAKFPAVCDDYKDGRNADAICRKTLATMFAHFAQETGAHDPNSTIPQWRQALYFLREAGCSDTAAGCGYNAECDPATWQGQVWQCGKQTDGSYKKYFGRGAKQLSYNYNYGPFSDAMFGTVRTLLDKPELVADTWLNLASAVFFYVYPQPPKPSMLHVVDGTWKPNAADLAANITAGFGASISIINGGIECGQGTDKQQALNRISYYQSMAGYFAVPIDRSEALSCAKMAPFPAGGAGAQLISWEQDWSYDPSRADGKTYACKLVGYQTPYSALKSGDYVRCVEHFFNVVLK